MWRESLTLLAAHRGAAALALVSAGLLSLSTSAYAVLAGPALHGFVTGRPGVLPLTVLHGTAAFDALPAFGSIGALAAAVLVTAVCKAAATWLHAWSSARLGERVAFALRVRLHAALLKQPVDAMRALGAGEVASRLGPEVEVVERFVVVGLLGGARDALQILALVATCLVAEPMLAAVAVVAYPLVLGPVAWVSRRARRTAEEAQALRGAVATLAVEHAQGLAVLRVARAETYAGARFEAAAGQLRDAAVRAVSARIASTPLTEVAGAVALVGTLAVARWRVDAGHSTPESAIAFLAALLLLYTPIKGLVRGAEVRAPAAAAWSRLQMFRDAPVSAPRRLPVTPEPGWGLRLQGVSVVRDGRRVLETVTCELPAGRITAVVGPNGAGKSTLAWVVLGLLPPSHGRLEWLDGSGHARTADELPTTAWVPQEGGLLRASLAENLTLGCVEPLPREALVEAMVRFGLGPVLESRGGDLATRLDEGGAGLSLGERRRLLFARAWLSSAPFVVLDEPEAGLDTEGLDRVIESVRALQEGRTVLLLTHEPRLVALAERVFELRRAAP
jgi:ABC-type multidrug transport system fused ATPase/permease subunit